MSTVPLRAPGTSVTPDTPAVPGTASGAPTHPGIVSPATEDEAGLHIVHMPFLKSGDIFVPTQRPYRIGEKIFLVLSLLDRPQKYQVAGKVVWVTPVGTPAETSGIGMYLGEDEQCRVLRRVIEKVLGKQANSQRPIQTLRFSPDTAHEVCAAAF